MEKETIPATEESLTLQIDDHPMANPRPLQLSPPHAVIVDGIPGTAAVGSMGGYSTRLNIVLESPHPDFGVEFGTKYFRFIAPGLVEWGHDGKRFNVLKVVQ
jgi:hypothetical protein